MRVEGVGTAFPKHFYSQAELLEVARSVWAGKLFNAERLESLFENVAVGGRHLALPLEAYENLDGFGAANDAWIRVGSEVGEEAVTEALAASGLGTSSIGALFVVSVTGIATPSLDARLMNRLPFPASLKRIPIFGLGCVAGAAGLARAADYVRGHPQEAALLLSVELCSLTLQRDDFSMANLISSGLFGDGAAAVVVAGEEVDGASGPRVVATRSSFYRDTERVMGWDIGDSGFKVVLSAEVPEMVQRHLQRDVEGFLSEHDLTIGDIDHWIAHTGGPKVLGSIEQTLGLSAGDLELSWKSLREVGNLSSTSVLLVLQETLARQPSNGAWGLVLAMGPGFCSELVLLRW